MKGSSRSGEAEWKGSGVHGVAASSCGKKGKGDKSKPLMAPTERPNRRPIGKRCGYEESFLSETQVIELCSEKLGVSFQAGQVIILLRLMKKRFWRRADLAFHSGLLRSQIALVLKVECFPNTRFWVLAARALDLEMDEFDRMVLDWQVAEKPGF